MTGGRIAAGALLQMAAIVVGFAALVSSGRGFGYATESAHAVEEHLTLALVAFACWVAGGLLLRETRH